MRKIILLIIAITLTQQLSANSNDTNTVDNRGMKQGVWREIIENNTWLGNYYNNQKSGSWMLFHPGTNPPMVKKMFTYLSDKKNGVAMEFDVNAYLIKQEFYKNDSLEGASVGYANGARIKSEIHYKSGKLNGIKKIYNLQNFKLQEEGKYINNKREGLTKWYYIDGKTNIEYNYINGNLEGAFKTYYNSGAINSEGTYKNNELEGDYSEFYENGKPKQNGKYINGKKEGLWKEYDENGKLKEIKYKNGLAKK